MVENTENIINPENIRVEPDMELLDAAEKLGRPIIYTSYVTNGELAIARFNKNGETRILTELTNEVDWKKDYLSKYIVSKMIITATAYLRRLNLMGENAQNVLNMMTAGIYSDLGDRKINELGFKKAEPDVGILSTSLDILPLPKQIFIPDRKIVVFTTNQMAESEKAEELRKTGIIVVPTGVEGADGAKIADYLNVQHYETVMMTTGPRVLKVFMDAGKMDYVFLSIVDREISGKVVTILPEGKGFEDYGFTLVTTEGSEKVKTNDGGVYSQIYQKWVKNETLKALRV